MERQTPATVDQEEKLGRDLKSAAERWRWRFNLPQKPNYNNVYYYKKSKKIFNAPCYDLDMDKPPDSYKGEFLQVKNTLHHTEYRLKRAQEEARNKKQDLIQQWKELEIKELELRNNFIQFNKFLGRNITKRKRAEQKFQEMQAMREECTEKIWQMKMDSEDIREYVESTKEMIATHKIYGDYLNSVVMTGGFKTIHHIINRYIVLEETKQNVAKKMNDTSEEYHNRRSINEKQLESSQLTFLSLSNELSELRRKYDDAKKRSNAWERVLNDICNKYAAVAENLSWSRMALRHMFDMAFFRVRRRRRRLIKTKKDDLGKMLRINETLKALERIEAQLRKLYGQQSVDTSMDPINEDFGIKVEELAPKSPGPKTRVVMGKWKRKKKRRVHMLGREGDMEDYTESADDPCPIKLSRDKWKYANVRNFAERYKEALLGIQEEKLREKMRELTYGSATSLSSTAQVNPKSHKSKWAAAAVAQKIAREVGGTEVHLPTPVPPTSLHLMATSDSVLVVQEDVIDNELLDLVNAGTRRRQMKKMIERKFAVMLDGNRENQVVSLPSISSGQHQRKEPLIEKEQAFVSGISPGKLPRIKIKPVRRISQKTK